MDQPRDHKPGGIKTPADAADRRRRESAAATADRKDATLRTKRLRREASTTSLGVSREPSTASLGALVAGAEEEGFIRLEVPEDIDQRVKQVVAAMKEKASPVGGPAHLEAVKALRQLLSNYEEPPYEAALSAGAIPALIAALQPPRMDASSLETIFEAAWALTNLAVGQAEVVEAVVPAAPVLIAYLGGGSGPAVAEQCAWALGNIAAEDSQYRQVLVANGAVRPLSLLLVQAAKSLTVGNGDDSAVAAGTTAAWALANMLRGSGSVEVGEFMGTEGAPEALIYLLDLEIATTNVYIGSEVVWVLAYITAAPSEAHLNRLVHLGVVKPLCHQIVSLVTQFVSEGQEAEWPLLIPLLRALGNIIGGGGKDALTQVLTPTPDSNQLIIAVVTAAQQVHHGLQREAAWVLSNIAGMPGKDGVLALHQAGAFPVLLSLLKEQPFHVRKEAAFALANICAGGGGGTGDLEALNHLFAADNDALRAMVSLMRSADVDAARLGLQFTEMLLRVLPSGVQEVEAVDGIDALEKVQFGEGVPEELKGAAEGLVNKYWSIE